MKMLSKTVGIYLNIVERTIVLALLICIGDALNAPTEYYVIGIIGFACMILSSALEVMSE